MSKAILRYVLVAIMLFSVIIIVGFVLIQTQRGYTEPVLPSLELLTSAAAVKFDNNGIGTQSFNNLAVTVQLSPYPLKSNTPTSLTLIALNTDIKRVELITPTLLVSAFDQTVAQEIEFHRKADSTFIANMNLGKSGQWRMRVNFDRQTSSGYSMLILTTAQ
jgi:hypothetical protein